MVLVILHLRRTHVPPYRHDAMHEFGRSHGSASGGGSAMSIAAGPYSNIEARRTVEAPSLALFLCGDVMTGRGVDQILPFSNRPDLYEAWMDDARDYVAL